VAGFPGRSVRFGDPRPVDPSCFAALPVVLAARETPPQSRAGVRGLFVCTECTYNVAMKKRYDFSGGKRGRIMPKEPEPRGKTRITIRLDEDLVDHFLKEAGASGGAMGYQTLINEALRQHVEGKAPKFEETLRRIVREEMRAAG